MTAPTVLTHKRGASFGYAGEKVLPEGNWSAAAQMRDASGNLLCTFAVSLTAPTADGDPHSLTIRATSTQTKTWPVGAHQMDVAFFDDTDPPEVVPTETFTVRVLERQTDVG